MFHRVLNSLILLPDRVCYQVPADVGLKAEPMTFPNAQGQPLHGLWVQAEQTDAGVDPATMPVVLFCPGTSGNLSSHLYYVEALCRAGCTVLGFDYTGFGASAGQASFHTLLTDVLCAADCLVQTKGIKRYGIFGLSLGANLALVAATQRPDIGAVAVEGLASYAEVVRGILQDGVMGPRTVTTILSDGKPQACRPYHVVNSWTVRPWFARQITRLGVGLFPFSGKTPEDPARLLGDTPGLFIHGIDDPLLPFESAWQAYEATLGPKRLWLMPDVGHAQEPMLAQDGEYVAQLHDFFGTALGQPGRTPLPSIACHILPNSATTVQLSNPGPACLTLVTTGTATSLASQTLWLAAQEQRPYEIPITAPRLASALRLFTTTGCDTAAQRRLTRRGQIYHATFRPLIRELARLLHERKLAEVGPVLHALPQERPEAPFDFFLGVYCVHIMQRTQRRYPQLAQLAAEAFCRYWHYGPLPSAQTSLWPLASAILGRAVGPAKAGQDL